MNEFSIYIHVPWCRRRCPYCNFYLVVGRPSNSFVDAVIDEWECRKADYSGGVASSLYFGGGTPSLLLPQELSRLMEYFFANVVIKHAEITLEANPEDLSPDYLNDLSKTPINRISLGIQSFDDAILQRLGRKHTSAMAKVAIKRLVDMGFNNISVDLILGVTGEEEAAVINSLNYLHDAGVKHVSAYLLTIEEGTDFERRIADGRMMHPLEDAQVDIYVRVQQELKRLGYVQYDISSYSQPGFSSKHNQSYWAGLDYIGLGAGAHSMRRLSSGGVERTQNRALLTAWLKNPTAKEHWSHETLSPDGALREALAFGLRNMAVGIRPNQLALRHQTALPTNFWSVIKKYHDLGWLREHEAALLITEQGALFADAIMRDILCA